jgi:uncharacterized short protein YbdD (DUF466 family)
MRSLREHWRYLWSALRTLTGDDAYDRYLLHLRARHPDRPPLDRQAFYAAELDRRWRQVNRCC